MSLPTEAETYTKLMEHLRLAEEACYTLAHLRGTHAWTLAGQKLNETQNVLRSLATGGSLQ